MVTANREKEDYREGTFDIRGHHLCNLWESFLYAQEEPQMSLNEIAEIAARESLDHCLRIDPYYATDIQGPNDANVLIRRARVLAGWTKFYRDFLTLPDEQNVRIFAAKDGICRSIIVGNHCSVFPREDDDQRTLRFLRAYDQISPTKNYSDAPELRRLNDSESGVVVCSTLSVVRKVFHHMIETSQRFV